MMQPLHNSVKALLAVLLLLLLAGVAPAQVVGQGLAFRNDLPGPVLVQGASVVNGMVRRGQPLLIAPGRTSYDANIPLGNRQITILDASQPNRLLLQQTILFTGGNQLLSIRPNPLGPVPPAVLTPAAP
jgi:hypothetical protein